VPLELQVSVPVLPSQLQAAGAFGVQLIPPTQLPAVQVPPPGHWLLSVHCTH